MWLLKHKMKLVVVSGVLVFLGALYLLSIYYFLTNGFRSYEKFCSRYISPIERFKTIHGFYPQTLLDVEKPSFSWRYDVAQCNYMADPDGFIFQTKNVGFTTSIY